MLTTFKKFFGTKNSRDIKKMGPLINKINSYEEQLQQLSDDELKAQTPKFKQLLKKEREEDEIGKNNIGLKLSPLSRCNYVHAHSIGESNERLFRGLHDEDLDGG